MRWALALGVCVVLAFGGCGGSEDSASTTASTSETTTTADTPRDTTTAQKQDKGKQTKAPSASKGDSQGQSNGNASSKPHPHRTKVPPISSAPTAGSRKPAPGVKTVAGADNSVQEYGVESGSAERREAAIALQAYLNARADEDWGTACSLLAKKPMEQLERLQQAAAKQGKDLNGCAGTMALLREAEAQAQAGTKITEVLSFRGGGEISGDPSYLLYIAPPGQALFSMPMYSESGAWKVGLAKAAELPVN